MKQKELNEKLIELGDKLRSKRISLKYSVRGFSQLTGLGRNTIYRIERGQNADISTLLIYAEAIEHIIIIEKMIIRHECTNYEYNKRKNERTNK